MIGKHINNIIKVTESCNFDCSYCLRNINDSSFIRLDTIDIFFKKLSLYKQFESIQNIWHGGEPLLIGLEFYKEAFSIIRYYFPNSNIKNSIQTNGYLLDHYVDFFENNNVGIGISLDGPEDINAQRVLKNGDSPFSKIIDNIRLLREHGIHYGTVGVLTRKAIGNEKRIYDFLKSVTPGARLNLVSPDGIKKDYVDRNGLAPTLQEAADILINLYDIWQADKPTDGKIFQLRPFYEIVESMFTGRNHVCELSNGCNNFLCLGSEGSVYPCGRFSYNKNFCMGNILEDSIEDIFLSKVEQTRSYRRESIENQCRGCEFKNICYGGCAHHSFTRGDYMNKTPYCSAYHTLFTHIKESLV